MADDNLDWRPDKDLPVVRTMTPPKDGKSTVSGIGVCYVEKYGDPFTSHEWEMGTWLQRRVWNENLRGIVHACELVGPPKKNGNGIRNQSYQFYRVINSPVKKKFEAVTNGKGEREYV